MLRTGQSGSTTVLLPAPFHIRSACTKLLQVIGLRMTVCATCSSAGLHESNESSGYILLERRALLVHTSFNAQEHCWRMRQVYILPA